jgi:ribA/ribD-fused uncharacterized protein
MTTPTKIDSFKGEYRWLSNFYLAEVVLDGFVYPSSEHAYQAAKTLNLEERRAILSMSVSEAKKAGRKVTMRSDWEDIKLDVMLRLLRQKFAHPELRSKLLATGDAELVEGNWWNDTFWGVCRGVGQNNLGKLLMVVREECRQAS